MGVNIRVIQIVSLLVVFQARKDSELDIGCRY